MQINKGLLPAKVNPDHLKSGLFCFFREEIIKLEQGDELLII